MPTTIRSFAKINLGLAIGPVRADGFHSLTTLYQTIAAHDMVTVEARPVAETSIRLTSNDERVPVTGRNTAERNTAYKSVTLALEAKKVTAEVRIYIDKRLPVQGGLGAGSGNAVAALIGLERELASHGIALLSGPERLRIAAQVGSDVPLFLIGGAVLGVGRGEEVYPMPDLPVTPCVVALPEVGVSTPQAFRDWDAKHLPPSSGNEVENLKPTEGLSGAPGVEGSGLREQDSDPTQANDRLEWGTLLEWGTQKVGFPAGSGLTEGAGFDRLNELSRALAAALCEPHSSGVFQEDPAAKTVLPADLVAGANPLHALVRTGTENDFEEVVFPQNPLFGEIKRVLAGREEAKAAALYVSLSGSGSALFGLYEGQEAARMAVSRLDGMGVRSLLTETMPREKYWRSMIAGSRE
ncbi:MAG: 4-(cytidine 5'-diphospho)-2-C-methyl-D-erythritol kinase [Silvibacterium sp.]|nr:4-(cytidine 5'-diphospho)-2-C-methyl-D-erythritol kinase [Silvibacterium sp.]